MRQYSTSGQGTNQQAFTTIDDLVSLSEELFYRLRQVSLYKHPLAMRRGVNAIEPKNRIVRAGGVTYFLDIRKTRDNRPYLTITESRYQGNTPKSSRNTIMVFRDTVKEFVGVVAEMGAML